MLRRTSFPPPPRSGVIGCLYYSADGRLLERMTVELDEALIEVPAEVLSEVISPSRIGNSNFFYHESQLSNARWHVGFSIQAFAEKLGSTPQSVATGGLEVRILSSQSVQYWRIDPNRKHVELLLEQRY